ncbi:TPA: hypothetical protein DCZ32_04125 [Candidatus Uhrbacteria bacterium]|nr:hypothetical protein [Candidatus Uhrbacteria bacterium]
MRALQKQARAGAQGRVRRCLGLLLDQAGSIPASWPVGQSNFWILQAAFYFSCNQQNDLVKQDKTAYNICGYEEHAH